MVFAQEWLPKMAELFWAVVVRKAAPDSLFSLSRSCRLTRKADFQSVFDQSHKVSRKGIICLYRPNGGDFPRLGIMLSKQQIRRAVDRNRVRRIVRESFRGVVADLPKVDIILMVRKDASLLNKQQLRLEIDQIWQKL